MKVITRSFAILFALFVSAFARADDAAFRPFEVDWQGDAAAPASVAFLLEAPAGNDGFIGAKQGHLVRPSGQRFRIWGINITGRATLPSKETAPRLAAHLARHGINCVRLHFLDLRAPSGLIDASRDDTRALDPAQLDKLDFFIAELKKLGVYTNLNLNVGRTYKPGDGVPDCELLGFAKAITYFNPRLIELQKEYARQLFTHRNAYTSNEYRNEPAVAIVELVNENSLVESWFSGRLLGKNTRKNPGTWSDIPASYEKELTELYNRWLREKLAPAKLAELRKEAGVASESPIPRLNPKEFKNASKARFLTEASFYMDIERRYFGDMQRYLKEELAVKSLLAGTSDHNHGRSGYPLLSSTSQLDIVDGHVYWQHPNYVTDPATGKKTGFNIPNTPMVNDPLRSTVVQLSRSAVAGKPYTVSEVNHPFPHEYACEGVPILAAYAALHDWDGIFWYTLAHQSLVGEAPHALGHFDLGPDPIKMAQIAACAPTFLRGDVQTARRTIERSYSTEQIRESLRLGWSDGPYFTPGFPLALPLVHSTRISSLGGAATGAFAPIDAESLVSDTGQMQWQGAKDKQGVVIVDTPRSQSIVGFAKANQRQTAQLAAQVDTPFAALTLTALEDKAIADSARLLLTATARVANSGMQWSAKRTSLDNWGKAPACIEPVAATLTLRNLAAAKSVQVQPLDGGGRPLGQPIAATQTPHGWAFKIGTPATVWYVINVAR